jgi:hypothetical protein
MINLRKQLASFWRARQARRARIAVLVLGDSHVRVFEHWWFNWALPQVRWHIVYVAGGTAAGLQNVASASGTRTRFDAALADIPHDIVILNLGEVDTGYNLWVRAQRRGTTAAALLPDLVSRYAQYIERVAAAHRLVVLSAPLPTLPNDFVPSDEVGSARRQVTQSQEARLALTLAFNDQVAIVCKRLGVTHLDDRLSSLGEDGRLRLSWIRTDCADHHYRRRTYAYWLASALKQHLT